MRGRYPETYHSGYRAGYTDRVYYRGGDYYDNSVHITHVTNVTQINAGPRPCKPKKHRPHDQRLGRPPKLWRYVCTAGLADGDKLARMRTGEGICELAKTVGYTARRAKASFGKNLRGIKSGLHQMGSSLLQIGDLLFG